MVAMAGVLEMFFPNNSATVHAQRGSSMYAWARESVRASVRVSALM